jgi:hypothetical protein
MSLAGDKLRSDIRTWLSPPDPWKNYNIARKSRHEQTGTWFINGSTLSEWKESGRNSLLWIHGKRQLLLALTLPQKLIVSPSVAGSGKSVIWCVNFNNFVSKIYSVGQFYDHRGH